MSEPTTQAGRAHLELNRPFQGCPKHFGNWTYNCSCADDIAAIEREARAPLVEALREALDECSLGFQVKVTAILAEYDK